MSQRRPAPGDPSRSGGPGIPELRSRIAAVDRAILAQVAERVELARRIGELKRESGSATMDPEREAAVIRRAVEHAREHGLPSEPVRELFWTLMGLCREAQLEDG